MTNPFVSAVGFAAVLLLHIAHPVDPGAQPGSSNAPYAGFTIAEVKSYAFPELIIPDDTHHFMLHANSVKVDSATAAFLEKKLR